MSSKTLPPDGPDRGATQGIEDEERVHVHMRQVAEHFDSACSATQTSEPSVSLLKHHH